MCPHDRLDEDGICRRCGADCRGIGAQRGPIDHTSDANYQVANAEITETLRELAEKIDSKLPQGWGFTLLLFEFDPDNSLFYISNAQRQDIIKVMREWIARNTQ